MAGSSTKRRTGFPAADDVNDSVTEAEPNHKVGRKRVKTSPVSDSNARRSSRTKKGSGGKIAQLQSLERVQIQSTRRVTHTDVVTANEPVNPMAPSSGKRLTVVNDRHRLLSKVGGLEQTPSAATQPYNFSSSSVSDPSLRFGFHLPSSTPDPSHPGSRAPSTSHSTSTAPTSTVPTSLEPSAPLSCNGSTAPVSVEKNGSMALASYEGPVIPGRPAALSRASSMAPVSRSNSTAPVSRISSRPVSPVPLRSSQIARRAHRSQARTLPVRDFDAASQLQEPSPPPYHRRGSEDPDAQPDDSRGDHTFPRTVSLSLGSRDLAIDELSPDEDERLAEAALYTPASRPDVSDRALAVGGERRAHSHVRTVSGGYDQFRGEQEPLEANPRAPDSHWDPASFSTSSQQSGEADTHTYHSSQRNGSPRPPAPERLRMTYSRPRLSAGTSVEEPLGANPRTSDSQIDPTLLAISAHQSGEDVVRAYHQRNGFPRPPAPEQLRTIYNQECPSTGISAENSPSQTAHIPGQSIGSPTTTQTVPDGELTGSATKLRSYPHKFREVIERAKLIAQCDSATKDPFPPRPTFLDISSTEIFNEALQECKNTPPGYWPNHRSQLGVLLWDSLMTWRSTIKAKAHEILPRYYNIGNDHTDMENQTRSRELIKGALFLRHSVDDEGSTNNMAHPGLENFIVEFFYGPSSLSAVFPEVFSREVLKVVVCLAATVLRAAFDEYVQTGTRQDRQFEYATYSRVFAGFLDMQHQIDRDAKHAMKTKKLRLQWASASRAAGQSQPMVTFSDEFRVVLD